MLLHVFITFKTIISCNLQQTSISNLPLKDYPYNPLYRKRGESGEIGAEGEIKKERKKKSGYAPEVVDIKNKITRSTFVFTFIFKGITRLRP